MKDQSILKIVEESSKVIGKTWPLYAFVTSNPLSGYENSHFTKAVNDAETIIGGDLYPKASVLKEAWQNGEINNEILKSVLSEGNVNLSPQDTLDKLEGYNNIQNHKNLDLDRIVVKWLMSFLDEGLAQWEMPNKHLGFFKAWKCLAKFDNEINNESLNIIPDDAEKAILFVLEDFPQEKHQKIITHHIAALPGWAGYIKYRSEENTAWQNKYNLSLVEYLAVRLTIAKTVGLEILPEETKKSFESEENNQLKYIWLKAWELSFQQSISAILENSSNKMDSDKTIPDAQMAFCIDTRSELIRRHVESQGNYETFGYAGFFGIAMDYKNLDDGLEIKSCPPILDSSYKVTEHEKEQDSGDVDKYLLKQDKVKFRNYFLSRMKNMLPSAFGFVEGSGVFYGISMLMKTLFPERLYNPKKKQEKSHENICDPQLDHIHSSDHQLPVEEKATIVKSAFKLLGWTEFAQFIIFVGHGGHSKNNPFASSLDCGACAASPGRHNARMLAKLANEDAVRQYLKEDGIDIPNQTIFIGAEHNTTTDEIVLFDAHVPESHLEKLNKIKTDLYSAQTTATQERLSVQQKSIMAAHQKTNDWSETRPEWGLAKNNAFVIGSRKLTKDFNLKGHSFLHSYEWDLDEDGSALEGIMQGPMVVTQWINNHYYFSTVDNQNFGGGSKIFHNITGKFGVVMGNGSDLKTGLPLQSVNETDEKLYHQPLRLSVYIHAPKDRIQSILEKNDNLKSLLDNEWIYLLAIDPTEDNTIYRYKGSLGWETTSAGKLEYNKSSV